MTPTEPGFYWAKHRFDGATCIVAVNPEREGVAWLSMDGYGCEDAEQFTDWQRIPTPGELEPVLFDHDPTEPGHENG